MRAQASSPISCSKHHPPADSSKQSATSAVSYALLHARNADPQSMHHGRCGQGCIQGRQNGKGEFLLPVRTSFERWPRWPRSLRLLRDEERPLRLTLLFKVPIPVERAGREYPWCEESKLVTSCTAWDGQRQHCADSVAIAFRSEHHQKTTHNHLYAAGPLLSS